MRATNRHLLVLVGVGLALGLASCAGGGLDSGDSPNVVLSVSQFPQIPPITATLDSGTGACIFTLPAAIQVTLRNDPKNSLAIVSPYDNVAVDSAVVDYVWDDGLTLTGRVQSTSGTIPANGTGTVPFTPIFGGDLTADRAGHSASMRISFHGRTVANETIQSLPASPGGAVINVNSCI